MLQNVVLGGEIGAGENRNRPMRSIPSTLSNQFGQSVTPASRGAVDQRVGSAGEKFDKLRLVGRVDRENIYQRDCSVLLGCLIHETTTWHGHP